MLDQVKKITEGVDKDIADETKDDQQLTKALLNLFQQRISE